MLLLEALLAAWELLLDSAVYVVAGLAISGLVRTFLGPDTVTRHLGKGKFMPVLKASLLGVPLPLCSCGVVPAAAGLQKQGANRGATTAFLISTPETGVDSIAVSWALLDPVLTVARPVVAFATAMVAGLTENLLPGQALDHDHASASDCTGDSTCADTCCDSTEEKVSLLEGQRYAFTTVWADLAGWFFLGLLLAGVLVAVIPDELVSAWLGGGLGSMLIALVAGIPIYICATSSTPVAAALIAQGASPGAALVFLMAGPATNAATLTMLLGTLGRRATAIYLGAIASCSMGFGLLLDTIYGLLGISATATVGHAAHLTPEWLEWAATVGLVALSLPLAWRWAREKLEPKPTEPEPEVAPCAGES